jgi:drug/metabolite transporter (DMT)-like permease
VEVLLGGISSILYGFADFLGGQAAKRVTAASVVAWSGVFSFPILLVVAVVLGGDAEFRDYALGLAAGLSGGMGLILLFAGLAAGRAAVVAPVAAAVGAVIPVAVAVVAGDRPSLGAWFGVAIAIPAMALSAWADDPSGSTRKGLLYGVSAGAGFGGFTAIIGLTNADSGLLPLVPARGGLILLVVALSLAGVWRLQGFVAIPRSLVISNAVLDVTANVTLLLALRAGSFALGAVAASFYPAVTVVLSRFVNHESLRRRQILGILLTLLALGLISGG